MSFGRFAVLITYYNEGVLLTECLNSLLSGSQLPDEIFVYDDYSTTPATDYVPVGKNIRVIRGTENRGPAYGRTELIKASTCEYVHLHDADDLFEPLFCEQIYQTILSDSPDIILNQFCEILGNGTINNVWDFSSLVQTNDLVAYVIQHSAPTAILTFRREIALLLDLSDCFLLPQAEDYYFGVLVSAHSRKHKLLTDNLIRVRRRADSRSRDKKSGKRKEQMISELKVLVLLARDLPTKYHAVICEKMSSVSSALYIMGCYEEANQGFNYAFSLGRPTYRDKPFMYRLLARMIGPIKTENLFYHYRAALPQSVRTIIHRLLAN